MTGSLTSRNIVPATTAAYDLGSVTVKFRNLYLSGQVNAATLSVSGDATIAGQLVVGSGGVSLTDAAGKVQAISSTYFASVDGSALTDLTAANLTAGGTFPQEDGSALTNLNGSNIASGSVPSSYGGVPAGLIAFSANGTCPTGWTEYTSARGRYIVGLVASGTSAGTVGTALTNEENRAGSASLGLSLTSGTLAVSKGTLSASTTLSGGKVYGSTSTNGAQIAASNGTGAVNTLDSEGLTASTSVSGSPSLSGAPSGSISGLSSVSGTTAPYIQLVACQKS